MDIDEPAIQAILTEWDLRIVRVISGEQCCVVFESVWKNLKVAVKVKKHKPGYIAHAGSCETKNIFWHPHVIKLYDFKEFRFLDGDCGVVLILEYMDIDVNKELKQRRAKNQPWSELELVDFLMQITSALVTAQSLRISHRDIKPENILNYQFQYKLSDFDLSKVTLEGTQEGSVIGTSKYWSPALRQAQENRSRTVLHDSFKSDVYSLGLTTAAMARLKPIICHQTSNLPTAISTELGKLTTYSRNFISLLESMLTHEEKFRPDFYQLRELIKERCGGEVSVAGEDGGEVDIETRTFEYEVTRGDGRTNNPDAEPCSFVISVDTPWTPSDPSQDLK